MNRKRGIFHALVAIAALAGTSLVALPTASATTQHCTDHTSEVKVISEDSPATVEVMDTTTGNLVEVVVTITGTDFTIEPVDPAIALGDASWCVKSSTSANSGTGLAGASASTNKHGVVQDISYVVIYSVTSVVPCNVTTTSGGQGVTTTDHGLGTTGPTSFLITWDMIRQPDRLQVFYQGVQLHDTGIVSGTGSATIVVPAGTSSLVTVTVTGPEQGTLWSYTVNCPATS